MQCWKCKRTSPKYRNHHHHHVIHFSWKNVFILYINNILLFHFKKKYMYSNRTTHTSPLTCVKLFINNKGNNLTFINKYKIKTQKSIIKCSTLSIVLNFQCRDDNNIFLMLFVIREQCMHTHCVDVTKYGRFYLLIYFTIIT